VIDRSKCLPFQSSKMVVPYHECHAVEPKQCYIEGGIRNSDAERQAIQKNKSRHSHIGYRPRNGGMKALRSEHLVECIRRQEDPTAINIHARLGCGGAFIAEKRDRRYHDTQWKRC